MKNELKDSITKVTISKRLKDTPAIITGQVSSSMRVMYEMMKQSGQDMMAQQQYE
jgi:HSP90 family molecular chaperone